MSEAAAIIEEAVEETPDVEEAESAEISPLDMSDDDFNKMLFPTAEPEEAEILLEEEQEDPGTEEAVVAVEEPDGVTEESASDVEEITEELPDTEETVAEETETEAETPPEVSEEDQLHQIFAPFKANGKDMKIDNVEDVRTLMQMGANYNKKMAQLKPNLKLLKMLENNDLLDENKLNYLIDLDKKNPDAVKKLIEDSSIDIDELDTENKTDYKPNTYTVNDKEVELDEALNSIKDTESYASTLNIISNKWDQTSKQALLENPAAIAVLNEHVAKGYYDKIASAVETERMFGRIPVGMSDLEAYKMVGDAINARGGITQPPGTSNSQQNVRRTANKRTVDPKLKDRKRAASSTKSSSKHNVKEVFNPLSMSDEDFEKMGMDKFLT